MNGMFIDVSIVLTWAESSILFFDEEKRRCLGEIGQADLSRGKVFVKEILSSFSLIWG